MAQYIFQVMREDNCELKIVNWEVGRTKRAKGVRYMLTEGDQTSGSEYTIEYKDVVL